MSEETQLYAAHSRDVLVRQLSYYLCHYNDPNPLLAVEFVGQMNIVKFDTTYKPDKTTPWWKWWKKRDILNVQYHKIELVFVRGGFSGNWKFMGSATG